MCALTGVDFCRRLGHKPLKTGLVALDHALGAQGLAHPAILEVVGHSGSGKTELLLNLCATNILPESFDGILLGGQPLLSLFAFPLPFLLSRNTFSCQSAYLFGCDKHPMTCGSGVWPGSGESFVYFSVGMVASSMTVKLVTLLDQLLLAACPKVGFTSLFLRLPLSRDLSTSHAPPRTHTLMLSVPPSRTLSLVRWLLPLFCCSCCCCFC